MVELRKRPKGVRSAPFGLGVLVFALAPAQIGYQDLGALLARQPSVSERWRQHLIASPFGTINAATFSFPRPVGTAIPEPLGYRLAGLDTRALDLIGAIYSEDAIVPAPYLPPPMAFPTVERRLKGDRLAPQTGPEQAAAQVELSASRQDGDATSEQTASVGPAVTRAPALHDPAEAADVEPAEDDVWPPYEREPDAPAMQSYDPFKTAHAAVAPRAASADNPALRTARLYFGRDPMGSASAAIERWVPGEEPVLVTRAASDPDIKQSAFAPGDAEKSGDGAAAAGGQSVAGKGEVTGAGRHPQSPAERLGLAGKERAKSEKCLAEAVYFEARGEPERGQKAVAQVVMNRVFSGFYPENVCGVVYQNSHRRLACQFTFACDGIPDRVNEPALWAQAKHIARDTLDGKIWLPEIGKATHYHASYVHPWWVRTMRKHKKIGVHIFYRPRKWGDGADEPVWGSAPAAAVGAEPTPAKL
jgi:spore germination cell wall hydrolase CwlJ-like protein